MDVPQDLRYTADHEWARLEDSAVRVGLTDFAQEALGDVVFVQLPSVGATNRRSLTSYAGPVESVRSQKRSRRGGVWRQIHSDIVPPRSFDLPR